MDQVSATNIVHFGFVLVAIIAAFTDFIKGKIYNLLTLPAIALALLWNLHAGTDYFLSSLVGMFLGFAVFFILYLLKIMGAGDGKLFMVFSTFLGAKSVFGLLVWSFVIGGASSLVILVLNKRTKPFVRELLLFFKSVFTPGLAIHWPRLDQKSKIPFGIAIATAFIIVGYFS